MPIRSLTLALAATAAVLAGCGGNAAAVTPAPRTPEAPPAARPEVDVDRSRRIEALVDTLRSQIEEEATRSEAPSLAFALVVDDDVPLAVAHGMADREARRAATVDTVYRIASVTKTFTAAAILKLRDAGALALDDAAAKHVHELAATNGEASKMTLVQLLTHSSGLPPSGRYASKRSDYQSSEEDVVAASRELVAAPGTVHEYSNLGFALLGVVASRVAKARYRDYVTREILAPLGMTSTSFDASAFEPARLAAGYYQARGRTARVPDIANGAAEGAGGLFSSASDMARWIRFQLSAWSADDASAPGPLAPATIREAHEPHMPTGFVSATASGTTFIRHSRAIGLAWKTHRTCDYEHLVEHSGDLGGYRARIWMAPRRSFGFVVIANADSAPVDGISERVLDTIARSGALEPRPAPAGAAPSVGPLPCPTP